MSIIHMFYQTVVASTLFFAVVCWVAGINRKDANKLKIGKEGPVCCGCEAEHSLGSGPKDRVRLKFLRIMDNTTRPLHRTLDSLKSRFSTDTDSPAVQQSDIKKINHTHRNTALQLRPSHSLTF